MRLIDADVFKEYICNAYERVKHMYPDGGEWARQITEDFCKDIDDQPTAETEWEWIPCSERLPEKRQDVIVTVNDGAIYTDTDEWIGTGFFAYGHNVIAWQSLPDPWKEEEE